MSPEVDNTLAYQPQTTEPTELYQNFVSRIENYNAGRVDMIIDLLDVRNTQFELARMLQQSNISMDYLHSH